MRYLIARFVSWLVATFLVDREFERIEKTPGLSLLAESATRSSHWPAVRRAFLAQNPVCACCGATEGLDVHHVEPFHLARTKELDPTNLITLCTNSNTLAGVNCHLAVGHLGNWKLVNERVREQAAAIRKGIDNEQN